MLTRGSDLHLDQDRRRHRQVPVRPAVGAAQPECLVRLLRGVLQIYGAMNFEGVHPQQCGYLRRKDRTQRRPELPRVPALLFLSTHVAQTLAKYSRFGLYALKGVRMRYRVQADPTAKTYSDLAITPVIDAEEEALEMFSLNDSARAAVDKARGQAQRRRQAEKAVVGG